MEQLNVLTTKDNEKLYKIIGQLMSTDKEFQIMITVPSGNKEMPAKSVETVKRTEEREKDFSPFILMQAGGGTCIFMIMLILTILNVVMAITHISWYGIMFRDVSNFIISFLLLVLLLYVPNQVFLFRSDKYISYFKQFRKERINKYLRCYFLSYILALIACSFSFILIELTKDRIEYFANKAG